MVGVFEVGAVPFNPNGWGPPESTASTVSATTTLPLHVPFAPFSRSEKLGRIADFTRNFPSSAANPSNRPSSRHGPGNPSDSPFDFSLDLDAFPLANPEDDSSFRLVDAKPPPRPKFGPKWRFNQNRPQLPQRRDEEVEARKREAEKERARRDRLYNLNRSNQNQQRREAAVFKSSNERRLERFKNRNFFKVTTTDDPVIRRLANEDKATVFATDTILATLMCAPRSVYSWDIVIQRVGNKLFFDKRDGSQLDLLSVHETSQEPLPEAKDDINSAYSLSVEAAYINQNFSQQVLVRDGNKVSFDEPNPFAKEGDEVASVAYRYRRWKLDNDIQLVCRCEVQSVVDVNNQKSFLTLNALNEFDPKYSGVDWRQKLETQRGAVLATELKNNANKFAKWTAQAILANADLMKLGYVSRVHPRDHFNHVILGVVGYKPRDFASQINLNTANMWGNCEVYCRLVYEVK
ncbi:Eukaryotic translation initiation factor 3 subunit D [Hibiscus syriacus]|uniref:Eukaryotic translation initiation factor 3 subunit D n=1 Tax=Hibiscus syriacus TaxID=106335 RepID=A0A6A2YCZ3_HIBSY|nr:Eukaryotic translation initiation factor 3 subunit D [Hibiscus syriacus]